MPTEQCVFLILYILWYIVHVQYASKKTSLGPLSMQISSDLGTHQKKLPINGPFNGAPIPVQPPFKPRAAPIQALFAIKLPINGPFNGALVPVQPPFKPRAAPIQALFAIIGSPVSVFVRFARFLHY